MGQGDVDRAKRLAQHLVEILTSYEEELMALEREAPAMGQLRRAVGITIAEACYLITDQNIAQAEWAPPADGRSSPAR
jgi:biotin synthase-related radical SAM superfamily protein